MCAYCVRLSHAAACLRIACDKGWIVSGNIEIVLQIEFVSRNAVVFFEFALDPHRSLVSGSHFYCLLRL